MPDTGRMVRIAVDTMGGDYAPEEIIKGVTMAAEKGDVGIILVGPMDLLKRELAKYKVSYLPISCVNADEVVKEGEHPAFAIHRKPNASVAVAVELVRTGEADAMVSAGPTGAALVSAIRSLGLMPGIERPVVCVPLVGFAPSTVLVDGGANVDCKPGHLLSFAVIGSVYAKRLLNINQPRIALLSIGQEEGKGSKLIQESYSLLKDSGLHFIGNIEGNDVLSGRANVIVCDGIVGNILLKFYESLGHYIVKWLGSRLSNLPLGEPIKKLLDQMVLFTKITENESDCGGVLWGVNGVVHLMHGSSRAKQASKAIVRAKDAVETDLIGALRSELAAIMGKQPNYRVRFRPS